MIKLGMAAAALATFFAFAASDISKHKEELIATLDKQISALQEAKSCVSAAVTQEDMKKCRMATKEHHMEMRGDRLEKRKNRIDERMQKLEEKKAKDH